MTLTARQAETAKPKEKSYKRFDGGGLYLEVTAKGSRYWRMKYRFGGKEKRLAFGVFPTVTLAEAREMRNQAKKVLAAGGDPGEVKKKRRRFKSSVQEIRLKPLPVNGIHRKPIAGHCVIETKSLIPLKRISFLILVSAL